MDENKFNRDYGDFFKDRNEDGEKSANDHVNEHTEPEQSASTYSYTYDPQDDSRQSVENTSSGDDLDTTDVEIKAPRPPSSIGITDQIGRSGGSAGGPSSWAYQQQKKRSSFKSVFASFMVGVLVMGGLMFASDKANLFTGGNHPAAAPVQSNTSVGTVAGNGSGGGVTNASLDVVRPATISQMVKQSSPAVVKITTYVKQRAQQANPFFNDPFFNQFFGDNGGGQQQQPQSSQSNKLQELGMGSGFFFDKSGYILTNEHVIDGAAQIKVTVEGYEKPFSAKLLGTSYDLDLAVLKIDGTKDFPTLRIGNADALNVGDWVVAIGNPYGFDHTVTVGVLSAKERPIDIPDSKGTRKYQHLLQTDASINPGNSGGPLLNLNGEVVGINTAVSTQAQGIGFAIPTNTITDVLDKLKNDQNVNVPHPFIGVEVQDIQSNWVKNLNLANADGAFVRAVYPGTPADQAGLQPYDVITEIDGSKIKNKDALISDVQKHKVGDRVVFTVVRNGKTMKVGLEIGDSSANR